MGDLNIEFLVGVQAWIVESPLDLCSSQLTCKSPIDLGIDWTVSSCPGNRWSDWQV